MSTTIYDGLTYRGTDAKLVPKLAEKRENLDGGKRIRFTLRKNVVFHNGEPFNAKAVKFTFDRLLGDIGKKGTQWAKRLIEKAEQGKLNEVIEKLLVCIVR
ncbi:MAG: ABC transporter substrate-binding protein [Rectinemataceae bacterium]|nr:ABC transporter substrate-binding protein [Rectinemataceae bacterium]